MRLAVILSYFLCLAQSVSSNTSSHEDQSNSGNVEKNMQVEEMNKRNVDTTKSDRCNDIETSTDRRVKNDESNEHDVFTASKDSNTNLPRKDTASENLDKETKADRSENALHKVNDEKIQTNQVQGHDAVPQDIENYLLRLEERQKSETLEAISKTKEELDKSLNVTVSGVLKDYEILKSQHAVTRAREDALKDQIETMHQQLAVLRDKAIKTENELEQYKDESEKKITTLQNEVLRKSEAMWGKCHDEIQVLKTELNNEREYRINQIIHINNTMQSNEQTLRETVTDSKDLLQKEIDEEIRVSRSYEYTIQKQIKTVEDTLSARFKQGTDDLQETLYREQQSLVDRLQKVSNELQTKYSELQNRLKEYKNVFERQSRKAMDDLKETAAALENTIEEKGKNLKANVNNYKLLTNKRLRLALNKFREAKTRLENQILDIESKFDRELKEKTHSLQENDELIKSEFTEQDTKLKRLNEDLQKDRDSFSEHKVKVETVIFPNIFDKGTFVPVFLLVAVLTVVNLFLPLILGGRHGYFSKNKDRQTPRKISELDKAISMVVFAEETKKISSRVLKDLRTTLPTGHKTVPVNTTFVRSYEDIEDIPATKICFMFAEFHERHVIIEEPGLGLGDLKRKTVEAITDMGGELVIIYVRDPGSRDLLGETLFNKNIYCALSQPELMKFSRNGRFLSMYTTLTEHQKQRLAEILNDKL